MMEEVRCKMEDVSQIVKEIKQSFRQMMDGAVAQSMRDKGLNYHLKSRSSVFMMASTEVPSTSTSYSFSTPVW